MRKAAWSLASAAMMVVLTATAAMADATYPPSPPAHHHPVPPGPPTAFTGSNISGPLLALAGLAVLGAVFLIGALLVTKAHD